MPINQVGKNRIRLVGMKNPAENPEQISERRGKIRTHKRAYFSFLSRGEGFACDKAKAIHPFD